MMHPRAGAWDGCMMLTQGTHKVSLDEQKALAHWNQIHAWCEQHVLKPHDWFYFTFWFDHAHDAVNFSLAWGGT